MGRIDRSFESIIHLEKQIIFWFAAFSTLFSSGQPLNVCDSCSFRTLKSAIFSSKDHDTIIVKAGSYKEYDIIIDKPLTIIGENLPTIDGEFKGSVITISADNVHLQGLRVLNVGTSYTEDFSAIRVRKSKYFLVRDMILENLFFGIYLEKSSEGSVINNKILGSALEEHNSGNGIQLWYSNHVEIVNNYVGHVRDGIYLEFSDDCLIRDNISSNNLRYGLHFMFSNDDIYENNIFSNNGAGVAVMFSKRIKMFGNQFQDNWGTAAYGMLLKEINDAEIVGNTFQKNTVAINVEGSNRILYKNNNFNENGWAVKVRGACYENHFVENNFLYNSFDVVYNTKLNTNQFDRNYWSNYNGYDLNKDGIGDVAYRPVKLFSYVANRTPETIILLRSLFMSLIDFSEKVSPVFTPDNLLDQNPSIRKIVW